MKQKIEAVAALMLSLLMLTSCGVDSQVDSPMDTQGELGTQIETESETEHVPVVTKVTITATGDCALGALSVHGYEGSFHSYYDQYGETHFFENFREIFEADDLTLINLECVFTDSNALVPKQFNIKGKPEYTGILTSSSVEACSLGNNHIVDYGDEGIADTKEVLDNAGVAYAYNDIIAYYTTDEGMVIAIVSASMIYDETDSQYLLDGVKEARAQGADLVIACCHWGVELDHYPQESQVDLGHALVDAGADLVVGNHSHCLQGIEAYNGKIICYSLGNFSFGGNRNPRIKDTAVFQQEFTFIDGQLQTDITAKIIPARISGYSDFNNYKPIIAEGEDAERIIEDMNTYSAPFESVTFDEEGTIILVENVEEN